MTFYAVKQGRKTGIFLTWDECKEQINGYSGAIYKKFKNKEDALLFLGERETEDKKEPQKESVINKEDELLAYVDGSYNSEGNIAGYGLVLIKNNNVIFKDIGSFRGDNYTESRNVYGELRGALKAVELAIANNFKSITIVYDYMGIEKWAKNEWRAKKELTKDYQDFMNKYSKIIDIKFIKVKAHTSEELGGDRFNAIADKLAKMAVGL